MRTNKLIIMAGAVAGILAAASGIVRARPIDSYTYWYTEYSGASYVAALANAYWNNAFRLESLDGSAYIETGSGYTYDTHISHSSPYRIQPDSVTWYVDWVKVESGAVAGSCVDASVTVSVVDMALNEDSESNDGCTFISW